MQRLHDIDEIRLKRFHPPVDLSKCTPGATIYTLAHRCSKMPYTRRNPQSLGTRYEPLLTLSETPACDVFKEMCSAYSSDYSALEFNEVSHDMGR